jgi:hypothetical protein
MKAAEKFFDARNVVTHQLIAATGTHNGIRLSRSTSPSLQVSIAKTNGVTKFMQENLITIVRV